MAITPNANVNFKRGSHSSLMGLSSYAEGTFYLTTDTNRLYFAQEANKLVDLNQYIHIWDASEHNNTALPQNGVDGVVLEEGDIYYLIDQNALIIYNGRNTGNSSTNSNWTQLNPDTTILASNAMINVGNKVNNSIQVSASVTDGNNVAQGSFTLTEGNDNVTLTKNGNEIIIETENDNDNTTYTIGTAATPAGQGNLVLTPYDDNVAGTPQNITFEGAGGITVESNSNGTITITGGGGISSISTRFDQQGKIVTSVPLADGSGTVYTTDVTPEIKYGENADQTANFISTLAPSAVSQTGRAVLDVYTTGEVDAKISAALSSADAMKFQGTVNSTDASTKIGQPGATSGTFAGNVGDTFKVTENLEIPGSLIHNENASLNGTARAGDLLVATGTDGSVIWEVVPAGDDDSVAVNLGTANDGNFAVVVGGQINDSSSGTMVLESGTNIDLSTAINGRRKTFTVSHATPTTGSAISIDSVVAEGQTGSTTLPAGTSVADSSIDIPVVTGMSLDSQGHVVSTTAKTYRIVDTHATLGAMTPNIVINAQNNKATIGYSVIYDGVSTPNTPFSIQTDQDNIRVTSVDASTIKLQLVWGSF